MKEIIKSSKDFKIIPDNFLSATILNIINIDDEKIEAELSAVKDEELKDYKQNSSVEIFGVNEVGLVYFKTKILKQDERKIILACTNDYSLIQRREYSRVNFNQGKVEFKEISNDNIIKVEDISAGGIKFISETPLEIGKKFAISIYITSNTCIKCKLIPIRTKKELNQGKEQYIISGKFSELENADRILLVQYAFKTKMEQQSKENRQ